MPRLYTPRTNSYDIIVMTPKEGGTVFLRANTIVSVMALPPHIPKDRNNENVVADGTHVICVISHQGHVVQYDVRDDAEEILEMIAEEKKDD